MYLIDYHIHTTHSFDAMSSMKEMCEKAIKLELNEICFTEHFSVDPRDVSYGVLNYQSYSNEVKKMQEIYKSDLNIKIGLEIGEPHLSDYKYILDEKLKSYDLDFIIGSIHNLDGVKIRDYMQGKSKQDIYKAYFEEVYIMVKNSDIDIVGHLDLIKRYAFLDYGNYDFNEHKEIIENILKVVISKDIGIEINLSGLRDYVKEFYPKKEILELYQKMGGEIITIGSDSHKTTDFSSQNRDILDLLKNMGFEYISTYNKRKRSLISL